MTDGWAASSGIVTQTGFDNRSGAGRVHAWMLKTPSLVAPWGWGCHSRTLSNGQSFSFTVWDSGPESPMITMWKGVTHFTETDRNNAADFVMRVYDTCPAGGGPAQLVSSDTSYGTRKRIRLTTPQIANRCLEVHVIAVHVPAGQTRNVYACDYFHSGPVGNH